MYQKWQDMYKAKLTLPDEAVALIRDGEVVSSAFGNGRLYHRSVASMIMAGSLETAIIAYFRRVRIFGLTAKRTCVDYIIEA